MTRFAVCTEPNQTNQLPAFSLHSWSLSFSLQGVAAMTVAGAVAGWYFSQLPKSNEGVPELEKRRYAGSRCVPGYAIIITSYGRVCKKRT